MSFWSFLRQGDDAGPGWGKSPRLQAGEVVRLQIGGRVGGTVSLAKVNSVGLRRIFLDLQDSTPLPRETLTLFFDRGDALYHFETRLVGPSRRGAVAVAWPRRIVRVQRRQFYRLLLETPTTVRVQQAVGTGTPVVARLVNLSGGGALVAVGKPLPAGLPVSVRIPSGKAGDLVSVDAQTLDCHVATQGAARVYFARLHFLPLSETQQDGIIAFIHERQRVLLRNRKLLRA